MEPSGNSSWVSFLNNSIKSLGIEPFWALLVCESVPLARVWSYWPGQCHVLSLETEWGLGQLYLLDMGWGWGKVSAPKEMRRLVPEATGMCFAGQKSHRPSEHPRLCPWLPTSFTSPISLPREMATGWRHVPRIFPLPPLTPELSS